MMDFLANHAITGFFVGKALGIKAVYLLILWHIGKKSWYIYKISKKQFFVNLALVVIVAGSGAQTCLGVLKLFNPKLYPVMATIGLEPYVVIPGFILLSSIGAWQLYICNKFVEQKFASPRNFFIAFWVTASILLLGILIGVWMELLDSMFSIIIACLITGATIAIIVKFQKFMEKFYGTLAYDTSTISK